VHGDEIVVEAGLDANELIAASGSFKLRDGLLVQAGARSPQETTSLN
jgi:membrane fusion protein (multidrug efflux system)